MKDKIQSNADFFRHIVKSNMNIELAYDLEGVRWLDGFLDRHRVAASQNTKEKLLHTAGSYLGECIRKTFGGAWIQNPEYGWGIRISDRITIFPFNKVQKQLENADGDSVLGLFTTIAPLLKSHPSPKRKPIPKRPWWKLW